MPIATGSYTSGNRKGINFYRPDGEIGKPDETAIAAASEVCGKSKDTQGHSK
ncbi:MULTISPECIES: hypothetical protein [Rhizobium]|uniref:Uncharacterized protein n=1 Tax=Rhizobium favelukesii TaxID=348824 RepID=W6S8N2_9HYPH|nr:MULTISPECIES: hypothetical protein [Rhizobium]MCS0463704.1 hypothetical protein [Rhizobium favelukesii]UFS78993.1 hypothetical protein LPB79_05045 [Rhizobium sp. T136]CDM62476.1 hypothetical protein LPU83_pLPU83d_1106 [Rhizobium favelukesii]